MGVTGGGLVFSVWFWLIVAVSAAPVSESETEELLSGRCAKREMSKRECHNSKIIVNVTKETTHMKIVTDNGDTLFNVDSRNANVQDVDSLVNIATSLFFPDSGSVLIDNSSNFFIIKNPTANGMKVVITNKLHQILFDKNIKEHNEEQKGIYVKCAHLIGVKVLVDPSTDINHLDGYNMTVLFWATLLGEKQLAKSLVERGADVNNVGPYDSSMPLVGAVSTGDEELMEYLIKHGARVNEPSMRNWTSVLHVAAYKGRVGCARILLKHGANISARDPEGATPLLYAAQRGQLDMVKELVGKGADVNASDKDGMTALHMAMHLGYEDLMYYLLRSGADVNSKTADGVTPLILAVQLYADEDATLRVVKHFVEHKADVNAKDKEGTTALFLASFKRFNKVKHYLIAQGAVY